MEDLPQEDLTVNHYGRLKKPVHAFLLHYYLSWIVHINRKLIKNL